MDPQIRDFLSGGPYAVAGASTVRSKFGNKVLRAYQQHGLEVIPVNPREKVIEGVAAVPDVASLPEGVRGLSIITPPAITEQLVDEAAQKGIRHVWMQPGAESPQAIAKARAHGMNVIAGGPCLLVELRFRENAS